MALIYEQAPVQGLVDFVKCHAYYMYPNRKHTENETEVVKLKKTISPGNGARVREIEE